MTSFRQVAVSLGIAPTAVEEELQLELMNSFSLAGGEPRTNHLSGTKALMLAVLEDAIRCYLDGRKHDAAEAENWIDSNWRGSPFTFVVVCETLLLEPEAVRRALKQMKADAVSSRETIPRARKNVRVPGRVHPRKPSREPRALRHAS